MDILQRVRGEYHKCQLGFVPAMKDMDICTAEKYDGADDYRLFYLGEQLKSIENEKTLFPRAFACVKTRSYWVTVHG